MSNMKTSAWRRCMRVTLTHRVPAGVMDKIEFRTNKKDENSKHYRYGPHFVLTVAKSAGQAGRFFHIYYTIQFALQCIFHFLASVTIGILAVVQKVFATLIQDAETAASRFFNTYQTYGNIANVTA